MMSDKQTLKIEFCDFWPGFIKDKNYFYDLLSLDYDIKIDSQDPDLLFFSVDYHREEKRYNYANHRCKKIFYTMESVPANFDIDHPIYIRNFQANYSIGKCDFAFTFDFSDDPRQYRLPWWVFQINWFNKGSYGYPDYLLPVKDIVSNEFIDHPKSKFCAAIFNNPVEERVDFYNRLSSYKKIDGYGKPFGNWFDGEKTKYNILKEYKFSLCFENRSYPGYYTEKPFHAKTAGTVPIYFSDRLVSKDMNEKAFINRSDFDSADSMVKYITEVDTNDNLYNEYKNQPLFKNNKIPDSFLPESVLNYFNQYILS